MNKDDGNGFNWPVKYDDAPHKIWEAWEICTREDLGSYTRPRVPSKPVGQLLITKGEMVFWTESSGFKDGYRYFWVEYRSVRWVELTYEDFKDKKFYYEERRDSLTNSPIYNVKDAYTAISAPLYVNRESYMDYKKYLRHYYPDYGDEYCSVYVLWNKEGRPIVQIREKAVGDYKVEYDIAYPGDEAYTPLHRLTLRLDLERLVREKLVIVELVHPAKCFGSSFLPSNRYEKPNPNFYQRRDTWPRRYYGELFPCDT